MTPCFFCCCCAQLLFLYILRTGKTLLACKNSQILLCHNICLFLFVTYPYHSKGLSSSQGLLSFQNGVSFCLPTPCQKIL